MSWPLDIVINISTDVDFNGIEQYRLSFYLEFIYFYVYSFIFYIFDLYDKTVNFIKSHHFFNKKFSKSTFIKIKWMN